MLLEFTALSVIYTLKVRNTAHQIAVILRIFSRHEHITVNKVSHRKKSYTLPVRIQQGNKLAVDKLSIGCRAISFSRCSGVCTLIGCLTRIGTLVTRIRSRLSCCGLFSYNVAVAYKKAPV